MTFYNSGNKAGKLLFHVIKGHWLKSNIPFIIHPTNDEWLTNPQHIADAFSNYYSTLYNLKDDHSIHQPTTLDIQTFLHKIKLPSLTEDQLDSLNKPFNHSEISLAIDSLPNNKSSGPDRYTTEYYKHFKQLLLHPISELFDAAAASSSSFPKEMLTALIVILSKPGKEPTHPQNLRPIYILNHNLKLYAKRNKECWALGVGVPIREQMINT